MINAGATPSEVAGILRGIPDVVVRDIDDGFSVQLGPDRVAYVSDAAPDEGTDIVVQDRVGDAAEVIYASLERTTDWPLWRTDDGGEIVQRCDGTPRRTAA